MHCGTQLPVLDVSSLFNMTASSQSFCDEIIFSIRIFCARTVTPYMLYSARPVLCSGRKVPSTLVSTSKTYDLPFYHLYIALLAKYYFNECMKSSKLKVCIMNNTNTNNYNSHFLQYASRQIHYSDILIFSYMGICELTFHHYYIVIIYITGRERFPVRS